MMYRELVCPREAAWVTVGTPGGERRQRGRGGEREGEGGGEERERGDINHKIISTT